MQVRGSLLQNPTNHHHNPHEANLSFALEDEKSLLFSIRDLVNQARYMEALELALPFACQEDVGIHGQEGSRPVHFQIQILLVIGSIYFNVGDYEKGRLYFEKILSLASMIGTTLGVAEAHCNLGTLCKLQGDMRSAIQHYNTALNINPHYWDAVYNLHVLFSAAGKRMEAVDLLKCSLSWSPFPHKVYFLIAQQYYSHENEAEVLSWERRCPIISFYGSHVMNLVKDLCLHSLRFKLDLTVVQFLAKIYYKEERNIPQAIETYENCIKTCFGLNNVENWMEILSSSLTISTLNFYQPTIELGDLINLFNNLGILWNEYGNTQKAITFYRFGLSFNPNNTYLLTNIGSIHKDQGQVAEAIIFYEKALSIEPDFFLALCNLANSYKDCQRVDLALPLYEKALILNPNFPDALCNYVHSLLFICEWSGREVYLTRLEALTEMQLRESPVSVPTVLPFHAFIYPFKNRSLFRLMGERQGLKIIRQAANIKSQIITEPHSQTSTLITSPLYQKSMDKSPFTSSQGKITIAYVSSDFGDHPLSHLLLSLFGLHDKTRYFVICVALSSSDGSMYRKRIEQDCDVFLDLSGIESLAEAALTILNPWQPQIMVNLNGFTKGARNELFALNLAPIQVSWMGYAATLGMHTVPYVIADPIALPENIAAEQFTETPVYLEDRSYFCTDHKQSYPELLNTNLVHQYKAINQVIIKGESGKPFLRNSGVYGDCSSVAMAFSPASPMLEEKALSAATGKMESFSQPTIVFGNFNQLYKIDPEVFACWMKILHKVPGSVLWLLQFPVIGQSRLEAQARKHGIDPERRLLFTAVAPKKEHIWRGLLVDLFLDTPACNAHTTAADILWAGTPILTIAGNKMCSRVAASLIHSLDDKVLCDTLITNNLTEYQERAIYLAKSTNRHILENVKDRIQKARLNGRLFDTEDMARSLEKVYVKLLKQ